VEDAGVVGIDRCVRSGVQERSDQPLAVRWLAGMADEDVAQDLLPAVVLLAMCDAVGSDSERVSLPSMQDLVLGRQQGIELVARHRRTWHGCQRRAITAVSRRAEANLWIRTERCAVTTT
jgi:hypothetical protein